MSIEQNELKKADLQNYFSQFRKNIVGIDATFESAYGNQPIVYADWIASGRLYGPIEDKIKNQFGPLVGNTHSEASETGRTMTIAYHEAHKLIKNHVNADKNDVIITTGFGMTSVLAKFQRILGLKIPEQLLPFCKIPDEEKPVVFLTHMEHHSNQTPWFESICDVVVIEPDENLFIDPENLRKEVKKYQNRKMKIGSFSACSNVTGIITPYYELAEIMHEFGGYCFVDFAASAPYVDIDMHPPKKEQKLDAIFFSPHKFLGGPGSSGVLIFCKSLYKNRIPDHPGGGTVLWTNPWGEHSYFDDIEIREDGGTPGFLQAIRTTLSIQLKERMNVQKMYDREAELIAKTFRRLRKIEGLSILGDNGLKRIGVFSFYIKGLHHNLIVKLLNDRYGVQVRGGCSCAGTYGHYLLNVDRDMSHRITEKINKGDLSEKPGWVRLSIHPTMTDEELDTILKAIKEVSIHAHEWMEEYNYVIEVNEFFHKTKEKELKREISHWFVVE
ncbi:MAG: aminotransferase class V-fold PLP-dependent enzyme [Cyclobacteriaceae bacterium]|nr:aminotransferase class V-fold PLP-dependent enzyme [Cyclobacteriaceae bacterium]